MRCRRGFLWTVLGLALAAAPAAGGRLLTWGQGLIRAGDYAQAVVYLEQEVVEHPSSAEGFTLLGRAYWRLGRLADARRVWGRAAELDPAQAAVLRWRLERLDRLERVVIILDEGPLPEGLRPGVTREALASAIVPLGFRAVNWQAGRGYGSAAALEALTPEAWGELRRLSGADLLVVGSVRADLMPPAAGEPVRVLAVGRARLVDASTGGVVGWATARAEGQGATGGQGAAAGVRQVGERLGRDLIGQLASRTLLHPDLAVGPADIALPKTSLLEGVPIPVEVTVRNQGDEGAASFRVEASDQLGDRRESLRTFQVVSLPPLSAAVLNFEWTPAGQGVHILRVQVDPEKRIPEAERANNLAERRVLVLTERQALRNLYRFALSYVARGSDDERRLAAEGNVLERGRDPQAVERLRQVAIDPGRRMVTVIGLGLRPWYVVSDAVAVPGARRAARLEAQRWLAEILGRPGRGGDDLQVFGARILAEEELPDGSYLVKVQAPVP